MTSATVPTGPQKGHRMTYEEIRQKRNSRIARLMLLNIISAKKNPNKPTTEQDRKVAKICRLYSRTIEMPSSSGHLLLPPFPVTIVTTKEPDNAITSD